ncbi:hypothetical protein FOL47_001403, partial [Perkinsus chesapeaki]
MAIRPVQRPHGGGLRRGRLLRFLDEGLNVVSIVTISFKFANIVGLVAKAASTSTRLPQALGIQCEARVDIKKTGPVAAFKSGRLMRIGKKQQQLSLTIRTRHCDRTDKLRPQPPVEPARLQRVALLSLRMASAALKNA